MSARRTLIIIVALAVGAVAAVVTLLYVNSAQSRANNNAKLVAVYMVAKDIPKGTTGDTAISNGYIKQGSIPKQFYPGTAVTSLSEIKGKVTPVEIPPNQVLVDSQFVSPTVATTTFSGTNIPHGQVAVTISLSSTDAVANLIVPGDKIDLMAQFQPISPTTGQPVPGLKWEHIFYQNVQVIAIGTAAAPTAGATTSPTNPGSSLFTLALPPEAAERVVMAAAQGAVTAALVPPDNQPVPIAAVQQGNIDGPVPPVFAPVPSLTPYGS